MTKTATCDQPSSVDSRDPTRTEPAQPGATLHELFAMHAPYVWNSLRRLGVPPSDLEDVTHDVFIEVHRRLGDYDGVRPVRPWLFAFAFRVASAHRRRAHRRHETAGEPDDVADARALPDEAAALQDDRRLVIAALQSVPLERRGVFVLHEIDGVDMNVIGRTLRIPVNTAYSRLRVARAEFAAAVKRLRPPRQHP